MTMIDEVTSAFDGHLEEIASAVKQQFRWIKRRYREKIDVNRIASKIELKACQKDELRCVVSRSLENITFCVMSSYSVRDCEKSRQSSLLFADIRYT